MPAAMSAIQLLLVGAIVGWASAVVVVVAVVVAVTAAAAAAAAAAAVAVRVAGIIQRSTVHISASLGVFERISPSDASSHPPPPCPIY